MKPVSRRQFLQIFGTVAAGSALGFTSESSHELRLDRKSIQLPNWTAGTTRIAVISDFHANSPFERDRAIRAIQLAAAQKPDLVVLPGDFINSCYADVLGYLEQSLEAIAELDCPVLASLGNHDYTARYPELIAKSLTKMGVQVLVNGSQGHGDVLIYGYDDGIYGSHPREVFRGKPPKNAIALYHEPDFVYKVDPGFSLMIAGHSHGGQICLPFGIPLACPYGARKYVSGYFANTNVPLFVSKGIGTGTVLRIRTYCPPEVNLLTVSRA